MKRFLPGLIIISSLFIFLNVLVSCTKTNTVTKTVTVTDTVTKIQKDTLVIKDTALTTAILTANSWKPLKTTALVGNTWYDYTRGGSGNTIDLDSEYITFNSNGSGVYTVSGVNSTFTWNFTDATNTSIIWNWNNAVPATVVTWENVVYKNASIAYTESYMYAGSKALTSGIRIPK